MPTVFDDVLEDIEMWLQDVNQEQDPVTPKTGNEVSSGYIEGIRIGH